MCFIFMFYSYSFTIIKRYLPPGSKVQKLVKEKILKIRKRLFVRTVKLVKFNKSLYIKRNFLKFLYFMSIKRSVQTSSDNFVK